MKIALIAPGIMPVPPPGWGAVEILIWDYYNELQAAGHNVVIINKIAIKIAIGSCSPFMIDYIQLGEEPT